MKQKSDKIEARITTVQQYSVPLPHPNDLIRYNDAVPNSAERIIAMAESEMQHRHKQEEVLLRNRVRVTYVSIFFSFVSVLCLSGLVGFALYIGASGAAIGVAIGAIASVAGIFMYAKTNQTKKGE